MQNILLVEDDRVIVENLTEFLKGEGFWVTAVSGQTAALKALETQMFELVLLDVTLAEGNGYSACTAMKAQYDVPVIFLTALGDEFSVVTGLDMGADDYISKPFRPRELSACTAMKAQYDVPVIFLTALGDEFSVVTGLDMGADDYISKPFRPRELVSRMKSVLRRSGKTQSVIRIGTLTVDTEKALVRKGQEELLLSALEYRLLLIFLNHRGKVLTRTALLEEIWDVSGEFVNDNTLTVYIKRLREKIETDPANPQLLLTVRGIGYKLGE